MRNDRLPGLPRRRIMVRCRRRGLMSEEEHPVDRTSQAADDSAAHQQEYYDYILSLHPKRIIFNPGAENNALYELAIENQITPLEACTLVLLSTDQY